jgi:hypothetical protein
VDGDLITLEVVDGIIGGLETCGRVYIAPTDDPDDPLAVEQDVVLWSDTLVTFNAVRGALPVGETVYMFLLNCNNVFNVVSEPVEFAPDPPAVMKPQLSWTTGSTPGLWKEYRLYRVPAPVPGQPVAPDVLLATYTVARDWDASILTDVREHVDELEDGTACSYYVIAIDHDGRAVKSNTVTLTAEDWPVVEETP